MLLLVVVLILKYLNKCLVYWNHQIKYWNNQISNWNHQISNWNHQIQIHNTDCSFKKKKKITNSKAKPVSSNSKN